MPITKPILRLIICASVAGVAACGGGIDAPVLPPAPTPPSQQATGLPAPTQTLAQDLGCAIPLAQLVLQSYDKAAAANAVKALGSLVPSFSSAGVGSYSCAASGKVDYTAETAGSRELSYSNCQSGGYTFDQGTATMTVSRDSGGVVTGYQLNFTGLNVTGPAPYVASAGLSGSLACKPGANGSAPQCITTLGGFLWGYDAAFDVNTATATGTHQCGTCAPNEISNVTFKNFTATGGTADVFGNNGSAVVTRISQTNFEVALRADGLERVYKYP